MWEYLAIACGIVIGIFWHAGAIRTHNWLADGALTSDRNADPAPSVVWFAIIRIVAWLVLLSVSLEARRSGYELLGAAGMSVFYTGLAVGVLKMLFYTTIGERSSEYHRWRPVVWLDRRRLLAR